MDSSNRRRSATGPRPGTTSVRVELRERLERERALVQPWMRDRQPRLVDDRPRPRAGGRDRPCAGRSAGRGGCGRAPARPRAARRGARRASSEVSTATAPLRNGGWSTIADRVGLAKRRDGDDLDPRLAAEQLDGAGQRRGAVAEVRPEADVRASHNGSLNRILQPESGHNAYNSRNAPHCPLSSSATAATAALRRSRRAAAAASRRRSSSCAPAARCTEAVFVRASGGRAVAPELGLYSLPTAAARGSCPRYGHAARSGSARRTGPPGSLAVTDFGDPLVPTEWWRAAIGVDTLTPPPPGKAVTIVDSGIDVTHPDFLDRQNTETLNPQEPAGIGGEHGTAVGSLVAAPDERRRARRDLSRGTAALVGRRPWSRHAARHGRDRAGHPRRRERRPRRRQPQPRLRREGARDRAGGLRGGRGRARSSSPPRATTATPATRSATRRASRTC